MFENLPRWLPKEEQCQFCYGGMQLDTIEIGNEEKNITLWYECKNNHCIAAKIIGKKNKSGVILSGYAKAWKEWNKKEGGKVQEVV